MWKCFVNPEGAVFNLTFFKARSNLLLCLRFWNQRIWRLKIKSIHFGFGLFWTGFRKGSVLSVSSLFFTNIWNSNIDILLQSHKLNLETDNTISTIKSFCTLYLPCQCCVCLWTCRRTERRSDSAEHGGYKRRRQQEKYERGLVNSCASVAYLYVHAVSKYPHALLNYMLVLQSDANFLWPSFLLPTRVPNDISGQRKTQ